ncbi:MAG: VWA domain-containing protein [Ferruginibacter sp.]
MIKRQTSLSRNIVQFCRFLRLKGFTLSVEEEATALNALQFIDYSDRNVFALALKSVCCRSRSQQNDFDALFNDYWKEIESAIDAKIKTTPQPVLKPGAKDPSFKSLKSWLNGNRNDAIEETASYSIHENLSQKDFSSVPADELDELMRTIKALSARLAAHTNRRYTKSGKPCLPDLRRTLRKNMRHGGELLEIAFRKPKRNRTRLVVLCDVSKSMDLYAAFLLQFMFAFQQSFNRIETFAFGTSLQCITGLLKQGDFKDTLGSLSQQNTNWSGGTRIGESFQQFNKEYASRVLDKRTILIILSDGWDTGNIDLLEQSMETIHARAKKVIWLNPVAGYAFYQPDAAGMQAALPFIDVFAPVHNVDSLRKLARWL